MKSKCLALLVTEHKTILRSVDVLQAMAKHAADSQRLNKEDVSGLLELVRLFVDDLH